MLLLSRFSHVQLCVTPWTVAHQAPLFPWDFPGKNTEGLPSPSPGDLPNQGLNLSPALAGGFLPLSRQGSP